MVLSILVKSLCLKRFGITSLCFKRTHTFTYYLLLFTYIFLLRIYYKMFSNS